MISTLPCADKHLLVQADLDGELDAAAAAALAAHLQDCPGCTALHADLAALSTSTRNQLTRYAAPASLHARVQALHSPATPRRRNAWRHAVSFGAGMAVAAGIAAFIVLPEPGRGVPDVVGAHIRALQPGHLVDVASSDQHTVKPWFDGRLDYVPPVRDFAAQRFPLIGGRLDYLAGRPVAALAYGRDKHLIDLFIWPGDAAPESGTVNGFNIIGWTQDGMIFRAVSDLNTKELGDFVHLMRSPAS